MIHGSGFQFHNNQHMNAKPFFLPAGQSKPKLVIKRGLALGIPGTNGPAKYQGGMPRFAVNSYDDIGTPGAYLTYYRHDPATNYAVKLIHARAIKNLAGFSQVLTTQNLGRDFDERHVRFALRLSF